MASGHHTGYSPPNMRSTQQTYAFYSPDVFTAEMRDRQARGKDPYGESDSRYRPGGAHGDHFPLEEQRRHAAEILDSPEQLMMAAQRDGESLPATRLKFTRMLCGFDEPGPSQKPQQQQQSRKKSSSHHSSSQRKKSSGSGSAR